MSGWNLPPGVTQAMIDRAYGYDQDEPPEPEPEPEDYELDYEYEDRYDDGFDQAEHDYWDDEYIYQTIGRRPTSDAERKCLVQLCHKINEWENPIAWNACYD